MLLPCLMSVPGRLSTSLPAPACLQSCSRGMGTGSCRQAVARARCTAAGVEVTYTGDSHAAYLTMAGSCTSVGSAGSQLISNSDASRAWDSTRSRGSDCAAGTAAWCQSHAHGQQTVDMRSAVRICLMDSC